MDLRKLGKSDLRLSAMGIGCWAFGGGAYWGEQSQKSVDDVTHKAIDLGINFFDTAEVYNDGASETSLGIALAGKRNSVLIGSKVAPANAAPAVLRRHCEASLKRLRTDRIDLYMMHWPITRHAIEHFSGDETLAAAPPSAGEAFSTLAALKKEGKIREIGLSNHGVRQMEEVFAETDQVVANEMAYNLVSRAVEEAVLPFCKEHDIGVVAYMPLQQGLLTGKYRSVEDIPGMLARSRHFHRSHGTGSRHGEEGAEAEIFAAVGALKEIAAEMGTTVATLSLAWVMAHAQVTTTIVGCRTLDQLDANLAAARFAMTAPLRAEIDAVTLPVLEKLGNNPDYYENRANSRIE